MTRRYFMIVMIGADVIINYLNHINKSAFYRSRIAKRTMKSPPEAEQKMIVVQKLSKK